MTPEKIAKIESRIEQLKARAAAAKKRLAEQERAKKYRAERLLVDIVLGNETLLSSVLETASDDQKKLLALLK
jgi:exonuclease I